MFFRILTLSLLLTSCASSGSKIEPHSSPEHDSAYNEVYEQSTRYAEVVDNFEAKFAITATWLNSGFREAQASRIRSLFGENQPILAKNEQESGFFVIVNTPNDKIAKLNNANLWAISIEVDGEKIKPKSIRRVKEKLRWRAFFPKVNDWSKEYLIVFDKTLTSPAMTLASPEAKVHLVW